MSQNQTRGWQGISARGLELKLRFLLPHHVDIRRKCNKIVIKLPKNWPPPPPVSKSEETIADRDHDRRISALPAGEKLISGSGIDQPWPQRSCARRPFGSGSRADWTRKTSYTWTQWPSPAPPVQHGVQNHTADASHLASRKNWPSSRSWASPKASEYPWPPPPPQLHYGVPPTGLNKCKYRSSTRTGPTMAGWSREEPQDDQELPDVIYPAPRPSVAFSRRRRPNDVVHDVVRGRAPFEGKWK